MPGPWITEAELLQEVADILKVPLARLDPYWARIISGNGGNGGANQDAANDINSILQGKGFTVAQIDAWDNRVTFNRDITLHLAFKKAGGLAQYDQNAIDSWDRRKQLMDAATIMIGGLVVAPGSDDGGGMSAGCITERDIGARYGRERDPCDDWDY